MMSSEIALRTSILTVRAITCDSSVSSRSITLRRNAPDFRIEDYAKDHPFAYQDEEAPDLAPYVQRWFSDPEDDVGRWLDTFLTRGASS